MTKKHYFFAAAAMLAVGFCSCSDDETPEQETYAVKLAENIVGGQISATPAAAPAGQTVTLTATPDADYALQDWTVTRADNNAAVPTADASATTTTFIMPEASVTVSATFAPEQAFSNKIATVRVQYGVARNRTGSFIQ